MSKVACLVRRGPIAERLDRCVVIDQWNDLFPNANLSHLTSSVSDHVPILLDTDKKVASNRRRTRRRGRKFFEAAWCREFNFEEQLDDSWRNGAVWNDRNMEFHDNKRRDPKQTVDFVRAYLIEFQRCQQIVSTTPKSAVSKVWQAPPPGVYKVNFDGSFQSASKEGSYGAIARDYEGNVLGAIAGRLELVADSFQAECLAALKAITWAKDMGFNNIVLEGDALSIIRKVTASMPDFSPIGVYIAEIKVLSSSFVSCLFSHVHRDGNVIAHDLASLGSSLSETRIWIEEVPDSIVAVLQTECNTLPV
ncbi:hypothetical protein COLO4_13164 [Corchorus olitorius]|uniref:RNase H type-1 domain-containing protein n=1 Tax=Corchorus olitorius TaxID=93759 RepID=A0A1R3JXX0_9ROSI|nr:hypothetical protein COLO4_13164 [Corchorus olitorius]